AAVELERRLHAGQRVEAHAAVAELPRGGDRLLGQRPPQPPAAGRRAHVEAFQLAGVAVEHADGHTADDLAVVDREQQRAVRRQVAGGQRGQLLVEALEAEVDAERLRVLGEQLAGSLDVGGRVWVQLADGRRHWSQATRPAWTTAAITGPPRW